MSFYPAKINERFLHLQNVGEETGANAVGSSASFVCGAALRLSLKVENGEINAAKFKASGCGFLMAAADVLCDAATRRHGDTATQKFSDFIEKQLDSFPEQRTHCLELCLETLQAATESYRSAQTEEFTGEKALICVCFGVLEETIERVIAENFCKTVEDVTRICNAGGGCGSCQPLILEILDSVG
jgi:NifU-like protein